MNEYPYKIKLSLVITFAAFLVATVTTACVRVRFGPIQSTSSQSMKSELVDSFLFRSADIFYPNGVPQNAAELPTLSDREVHKIKDIFDGILDDLLDQYSQRRKILSKFFGHPLESRIKVTLTLVNTGHPVWDITPDGQITVDVKVAQAVYRSILLASLDELSEARSDEILGFALDSDTLHHSDRQDKADDVRAIADFLQLKKVVEQTPAHTAYGDMIDLVKGNYTGSNLQMIGALLTYSKPIESRYMMSFQFMLAHELGHYALGHFNGVPEKILPTSSVCATSIAREYDADAYAVLLIKLYNEDPFVLSDIYYDGYEGFFEYGYKFAEFPNDSCSHPDFNQRRQRLEEIIASAQRQGLLRTDSEINCDNLKKRFSANPDLMLLSRLRDEYKSCLDNKKNNRIRN